MRIIDNISSFRKSELVRSSFYSAGATLIKLGTAFLMSKVVAIYLGPEGLGLIGQLSNLVTIVLVLAGGAINNGIVKYVAQFQAQNPTLLPLVTSTGFKLALILGILSSLGLLFLSPWMAKYILFDSQYESVFVVFGCTVILYAMNTFLLSIVNGRKSFKKFNLISGITSIVGLLISFVLIKVLGVKGALLAVVTNQSLVFFITLFILRKEPWMKINNFFGPSSKEMFWKLSNFILMTLVSTACVPFSQIFVRSTVIQELSLQSAGLWEAINRISGLYLLFVTTSLSTYYLPRLSEISDKHELRGEILKVSKLILPIVISCCLAIYFLRHFIIKLLFTSEFGAAQELFAFQLVGDFFKIASWLLAFQMVAKAMTVQFIITEILFSLSYVGLSVWGLDTFGLKGLTITYAANYFLYFVLMLILFRKIIFVNGK